MKLIQQLLEMAKGKQKRAAQAKRRRKKKLESPTADKTRNLAALGMQTTGAGQHGRKSSKDKRREAKKNLRKEMDY